MAERSLNSAYLFYNIVTIVYSY